jgi:hypothetical protein
MRIFSILTILFMCACGQSNNSELKIRNGDPLPDKYENVMKMTSASGRSCVGTAIDDHHLLTAASCLGSETEWTVDNSGTKVSVKSIKIHAGYKPTRLYTIDVATLTTATPVKAPWYPTIVQTNLPCHTEGLAVGFGEELNTAHGQRNTGRIVLGNYFYLYDASTQQRIPNGMVFFSGPKRQMVCQGDEGGPVFVDGKIAGILSALHCINCRCINQAPYVALKGLVL